MNVQTLAKLYTGYLNPLDAWQLGSIEAEGDAVQMIFDASCVFSALLSFRSWVEPG